MGLFKDFDSFTENTRAFASIYRLTGKDYNDFGKFANCVDNPRTHYSLIQCKEERCNDKFPIDMSIGACFPKECSAEDISWLLPHILPLVNEHIIPYQFANVNDVDKKLKEVNISADEVRFVDVVAENKKVTSFGIGTFCAFLMCSVLIALIVGSTFADWFFKNKEFKK